MGVKFKDISYKKILNKLNLELNNNQIISIISYDEEKINNLFDLIYGIKLPEDGEIVVNRNTINKNCKEKRLNIIRKNIAYLNYDCNETLFNISILEDIKYALKKVNVKRIYELLELFNLEQDICKKSYIEISDSEKKKICIISTLLKDAKVTLLNNLTEYLDAKSKQNLVKYLRKEKRNNKLFIISSQNSDFLLQVSDKLLIIDDNEIKLEEDKYSLLGNKTLMKKVKMAVPMVIKFKTKALEQKNVKLNHRDTINDLIKDVYRNAAKFDK